MNAGVGFLGDVGDDVGGFQMRRVGAVDLGIDQRMSDYLVVFPDIFVVVPDIVRAVETVPL